MPDTLEDIHRSDNPIVIQHNEFFVRVFEKLDTVSNDTREVLFILSGNKLNNYSGMVSKVNNLDERVGKLEERALVEETKTESTDLRSKKNRDWLVAVSGVLGALIAELINWLINHKK